MNEKIINDLIEFGLSEYEAKVYLTLTTRGPLTASEISKLTKIPYSKIYETIKKLKLRTIIEVSSENNHKKFKVLEPMHLMKRIIKEKEDYLNNLKNKTKKILEQIKKQKVPYRVEEGIWISEGKKEFLKRISLMLKKASKYAYGITKDFSRLSVLDDEIINAIRRGVKVKVLGIEKLDYLNLERAKWYVSQDVEVRIAQLGIQPRICLIDDKEVCIRIDNQDNSEFIWSNNTALINFVKSYFEVLWKNAKNINFVN